MKAGANLFLDGFLRQAGCPLCGRREAVRGPPLLWVRAGSWFTIRFTLAKLRSQGSQVSPGTGFRQQHLLVGFMEKLVRWLGNLLGR